jgi:hypothetical protein
MKTQISRLNPALHAPWSGVYHQQGRMISDADWNALSEIAKARLDRALLDVIGSGAPRRGGAIVEDGGSFGLALGTTYVDGIRATLEAEPPAAPGTPFAFDAQADFPQPPPRPEGPHLLYLDVWERSVIGLEAGQLIDPALHGADTTTRTRTMAQVKWAPAGFEAEDPGQHPPIGQARLSLTLRQGLTSIDPCEPCSDEIELQDRVGNYLFRVEIHDVVLDAGGAPERVVLKWSRENGAEAAGIGHEPPGFVASDWIYEFYDGASARAASECHLGYHHPDVLAAWSPRRGELVEGYPASPPLGFALVRRWDGYAELEKSGADWRLASTVVDSETLLKGKDRNQRLSPALGEEAHGRVTEGPQVLLALDTMTVTIELADHPLLAGDYWHAEVREAVHAPGDALLTDAPPLGILHHYMCLAEIDGETVTPLTKDDCRRFGFPRLTDLTARDVCFDNAVCEAPDARTVQDALDHLCRQRDLRWHNQHLHGWGIVCGLIVECCPEPEEDEPDDDDGQDCVVVTKGYAITCEGDDIVLDEPLHVDLLDEIARHDEGAQQPILTEGAGTACLVLDLEEGAPVVRVEPHEDETGSFLSGLLDGTLLGDFIQHCVLDLVTALTKELSFVDGEEIDDGDALVSDQRKKAVAFGNLAIQLVNRANGAYVWLSPREHEILRDIYEGLRTLLRSKTFCAMFQGNPFPDYPFPDTGIDTFFGRATHTKIKSDPAGRRLYVYGGADATIHVFDTQKGELIEIIEMPAAEGAEVTAVACTSDGSLLYAAASIRGEDTILGVAQVGQTHVWEKPMIVLCDMTISEMVVASKDDGLLHAIGVGRGLFFLRPDLLREQSTPKPAPVYAFNAVGQMAVDPTTSRAFATAAQVDDDEPREIYDAIAVLDLAVSGELGVEPPLLPIFDIAGAKRSGRDELALKPARDSRSATRLYVVVDGLTTDEDKAILTIDVPPGSAADLQTSTQLPVEATAIALAYHPKEDVLIAAFEDSYRLQTMTEDGGKVIHARIPVQVQPVDILVGPEGQVYVLNFLSTTVTAIPPNELVSSDERLAALATYRYQILLAFYALFGGLLQYLKDCLCHHLLVKCPECDGTEKIYLACVEIRDNAIYNICNFGKRKYVKSFPAVEYWLSLIPIVPLIKQAVAAACCSVLPNLLEQFQQSVAPPPPPPDTGAKTGVAAGFKGQQSRQIITTYKRTDPRTVMREQLGGIGLYGVLARDVTTQMLGAPSIAGGGIRKQALLGTPVAEAERELAAAGVNVVDRRPYDARIANRYIADYASTPLRLRRGTEVVIYEREGKAALIVERSAAEIKQTLDPAIEEKLAALEQRREALADTGSVEDGFQTLETRKQAVEADLTSLQSQVEALRSERITEEQRLAAARADKDALKADLEEINAALKAAAQTRLTLKREIEAARPVRELEGITPEIEAGLAEIQIRSVGELANATEAQLRAAKVGQNAAARRALIEAAKKRME